MGRIKNTETYPIKSNPTQSDFVIGSDSEQNGKTVNFPVGSFGQDNVTAQNNRYRIVYTGVAGDPQSIADLINSFSPAVEILPDEIAWFYIIKPNNSESGGLPTQEFWGLQGLGAGTYGLGSSTTVQAGQLMLLESRRVESVDPDDVINSVLVDYSVVADSSKQTFLDRINNSTDTYEIQAGTNWFFKGTAGGNEILYGWKGSNGTYGNGGATAVADDIFLITDESTNPSSETPSGFEKIDEGNGEGRRLIGRDPNNHGNIGLNAIDASFSNVAGSYGATGELSVAFGELVEASGYASFAQGYDVRATGAFSSVFGYQNNSAGYASFMQGFNNTEVTTTGYAFTAGTNNRNGTNAGFMSGVDLDTSSGVATAVFGAANAPVAATADGSSLTNPMIIIGCGTHTTPVGSPWTAIKRDNLLVGLRNGTITLPVTTPAIIDAEVTGRHVVTREWIEAQGFLTGSGSGSGSLEAIDEGNGIGYIISGRNPSNYGNIGFRAKDFSYNPSASTTLGAVGQDSFSQGVGNGAFSYGETSLGLFGTTYTPNSQNSSSATDRIFNIGNGISDGTRSDAVTVLKNGRVGLGIPNFETDLGLERLVVNGTAKANILSTEVYTAATLPLPSIGMRAIITDATSNVFYSIIAGGGTNVVPVYYDGANWRIG